MTAKDPLRYFRVEAREISEALGRGALELERESSPELIARLMRLAHTLKGAASVVKQRAIAERTHRLEDALAPLRDHAGTVPRDAAEAVVALVDAIAGEVAAIAPAPAPAPPGRAPAEATADEGFQLPRGDTAEMDALRDGIAEATVEIGGIRRAADLAEQARQLAGLAADRAPSRDPATERLRQDADALRGLLARLEQSLRGSVDRSERELRGSLAAAERLRLVPCSAALASLERSVRDAAHALGKRAGVTIRGSEIRLEGQVLGQVQRALVQLLRNAVAHGIEPPAERVAAGKPEQGAITVEIVRRGDRVAFLCSDDGAGIDAAAVRRAAQARGLAPPSDDAALLALLFQGGLSTSSAVTEAAGRGVGLEVVREVAARLGGEVAARSDKGRGTTVELVVPVSLASLDALLVEAGGAVAALPIEAVRRAARLAPGDVMRAADRETFVHDGTSIAFAPLARLAATASSQAQAPRSAVVVAGGSALAAIGIDRLLGVANLVVRPAPALAFADPVVSGVYLDAEGAARPVLDPARLVAAALGAASAAEAPARRPPPILVIDDSLTTRVLEQSILESAGYEVDLASSAEQGLEMARARRYGLFLVDVEMPGMDGFAFVERTRADAELHEVPAILVTSRNAPEDRRRGLAAGAHAYVVKGEFDQGKVLATIRALLERQ